MKIENPIQIELSLKIQGHIELELRGGTEVEAAWIPEHTECLYKYISHSAIGLDCISCYHGIDLILAIK